MLFDPGEGVGSSYFGLRTDDTASILVRPDPTGGFCHFFFKISRDGSGRVGSDREVFKLSGIGSGSFQTLRDRIDDLTREV